MLLVLFIYELVSSDGWGSKGETTLDVESDASESPK